MLLIGLSLLLMGWQSQGGTIAMPLPRWKLVTLFSHPTSPLRHQHLPYSLHEA